MMNKISLFRLLVSLLIILGNMQVAYASPRCSKVSGWAGAGDSNYGPSGITSIINVTDDEEFQPIGTILGSSASTPMSIFGQPGGFDPEKVLFKCSADATNLNVAFSTNGDSSYAGKYVIDAAGVPESTYRSAIRYVGFRVRDSLSGRYFTSRWQYRPLTGLDRDEDGNILVKAKNFGSASIELIRIPYGNALINSGLLTHNQPLGYFAMVGPGLSYPKEGVEHAADYNGWYHNWPGNISITRQITVRRAKMCAFSSVTPHVQFPLISRSELDHGGKVSSSFSVVYRCQNEYESGIAPGQNAIGFRIRDDVYAASLSEGIINAEGGVQYLLSNGYGSDPSIATGVGIELKDEYGTSMNWLSNENLVSGGKNAGWYPINGHEISDTTGIKKYQQDFNVYLSKIIGKTVTTGKVNAYAEVFIRVQ
ncbi:fimbrial protein [Photobacterium damselae]|uniref:fimbrial protein n=1 Tax=Photobacterium damselae TaxID=38293 RepID=UPI000D07113B|nr:fimbrial protein [Photobacterium damselae]PSB84773.1 hypothetical protein C5F62_05555 [Photobacterium damselae subsp. damselae]